MKKSRRTTLKTLGALALGTLFAPLTKLQAKSLSTLDAKLAKKLQVKAILIGAGNRGNLFGKYAKSYAHHLQIVGVADPKNSKQAKLFAKTNGIATANCPREAKDLLKQPKFADVAILTEQGNDPSLAISALKAGYEVWMDQAFFSISAEREVEAAAKQSVGSVKVVHVVTKDILSDRSIIAKQSLFSPTFQVGDYSYFMVL